MKTINQAMVELIRAIMELHKISINDIKPEEKTLKDRIDELKKKEVNK